MISGPPSLHVVRQPGATAENDEEHHGENQVGGRGTDGKNHSITPLWLDVSWGPPSTGACGWLRRHWPQDLGPWSPPCVTGAAAASSIQDEPSAEAHRWEAILHRRSEYVRMPGRRGLQAGVDSSRALADSRSKSPNASASTGGEKWKPWPVVHPCRRRINISCGRSMPSATVSSCSVCPSRRIVCTSAASLPVDRRSTKLRSILRTSTGKRCR